MTEENTAYYFVQHCTNGTQWNIISKVDAAGNSRVEKKYQYLHTTPSNGVNYYRLIQVDIDGRQEFSKIVSLQIASEKAAIVVYPNPTSNGVVQVNTTAAGILMVFNNSGALVKQAEVTAGTNALDLSILPKGVYRLKLGEVTASLLIK